MKNNLTETKSPLMYKAPVMEQSAPVKFIFDKYTHGNALYIGMLMDMDGEFELWCDITVNLPSSAEGENCGYVDMPNIFDDNFLVWLYENGFIESASPLAYGCNGFSKYPLVKFNIEKMKEYEYKEDKRGK